MRRYVSPAVRRVAKGIGARHLLLRQDVAANLAQPVKTGNPYLRHVSPRTAESMPPQAPAGSTDSLGGIAIAPATGP
ncbi:MAG TPA: hypothetical protein VJO52_05230 [Gemmatimonadaceae bacterium]|nr:hypothetical protein [Gemmatimonadaceae bacterium]